MDVPVLRSRPSHSTRIALLLAVGVVALSCLAGTAVAESTADGSANATADAETVPLTSGESHWDGQALQFSNAADAGETYELYRLDQTDGGVERIFVSAVSLDSTGTATVDTGAAGVDPGTYVLIDGDDDPVRVEDGTVSGSTAQDAASFTVYNQTLSATFDPATAAPGDETTLSLTSTRGSYDVNVTSPDLSDARLQTLFGSTTVDIGTTDLDRNVTVPDLSEGDYTVEFAATDSDASATATLTVDDEATLGDDPESSPEADGGLTTGEAYLAPTVLSVEAEADANTAYVLYRTGGDDPAFVTEVTLNDSGVGLIDIGTELFEDGTYALQNDEGEWVAVENGIVTSTTTRANATFSINVESWASPEPNDPDGDGLFEDVNADNQTGFFDALTYYNNRNSGVIADNPAKFDFDGDGQAGTLFDAIALYNEVSQ